MTIVKQKNSLRLDTKTYDEMDIFNEIQEDVNLLAALGHDYMKKYIYKVVINKRKGTKRLGCCKRLSQGVYEIQITEKYLRNLDSKEIHNTIMHEVIHSARSCMNHGPDWVFLANKVNANYEFTPIQRLSNDPTALQLVKESAKYFLFCPNCGKEYHWQRRPKYWKEFTSGKGKCGRCGEKLKFDIT